MYFYNGAMEYINNPGDTFDTVFLTRSKNTLEKLFNAGWLVSFIQFNSVQGSSMKLITSYLKSNFGTILDNDIVIKRDFIACI